jgi:hypothetical protein
MTPRLKISMSSGSKKETQIHFSFLSKIPGDETPSGSPTGPLWREIPVYRAFCVSLENLIKSPLNKKALKRCTPPCSPKAGPLWKQTPISELCLTHLSVFTLYSD